MESDTRLLLEVIAGPDTGRRAACPDGIIGIGRDPRNDLVLSDARVAGRHGEIWLSDDSCVYVHLDKRCGSSVEQGPRILQLYDKGRCETPLEDGAQITILENVIAVHLERPPQESDRNASGDDETEQFFGIHVDTQEFLAWSGSLNSWGDAPGPVVVRTVDEPPELPPDDSKTQVIEDTLVFLEPGPKAQDSAAAGEGNGPASPAPVVEPALAEDIHTDCRAAQALLSQQLQLCEQLLRAGSFGSAVTKSLRGVLAMFPHAFCAAAFLSTAEGLVPWAVRFTPGTQQHSMASVFGRRQVTQVNEKAAPARIGREDLDAKLDADLCAGPSQSCLFVPLEGKADSLGVLAVAGRDSSHPLTDSDLERCARLAKSVACSLEKARKRASLEKLFEATLPLCARLAEAAEPARAGHAERVAASSLALAQAAREMLALSSDGLKCIHAAALLHELGRVGVPAELLHKTQRLGAAELAALGARFKLIAARWLSHRQKNLLQNLTKQARAPQQDVLERVVQEQDNLSWYLDQARSFLEHLAGCRRLSSAQRKKLKELGSVEIRLGPDESYRLLEPHERACLGQSGGFLSERERTLLARQRRWAVALLGKLPWPAALTRVPQLIAQLSCGTGKPAAQLSPESRVLAIAEGFDELLLSGHAPEQALGRLQRQAEDGKLDARLVALFTRQIQGRLAKKPAPQA